MKHFLGLFKNQSGHETYKEFHFETEHEAFKQARFFAFMTNLEFVEFVEL